MASWRKQVSQPEVRLTARVEGMVQGVGFRYRTVMKAYELSLTGTVKNNDDGSVAVVAEGTRDAVDEFLGWLKSSRAPGRVFRVDEQVSTASGEFPDFDIIA